MGLVNRALGAVLALALVVAGAVTLFEIGAVVVGSRPLVAPHDRWLRDLSDQAWAERPARLTCAALAAAGLALVALQLLRQRPAEVTAAAGAPLPTRVRRPDLEREVAAELRQLPGVATARVRLRRRGLDLRVTYVTGDPLSLRDQLAVAGRQSLSARGADAGGPVHVDLRRQPARSS
ncbi:MAG: hypothetical protein ABIS47_04215 [Acidimicrobiales bacterium]